MALINPRGSGPDEQFALEIVHSVGVNRWDVDLVWVRDEDQGEQ